MSEILTPTVNTKYRVDVDTADSDTAPAWAQIRSVNSFQPAVANTTQDATDYDSQGWGADAVTLRKWSLPLVLLRKQTAGGAYDVGQEKLRAAADALTPVHVRWYDRDGGDDAYEGWALVQWEPQGGDGSGLSTVNATLLGQGARTKLASNPATTPAVPIISSVTPANGTAAGGDLVVIKGTGFTGTVAVTGVKFGGTNASKFTVLDDNTIAAVTPAHAAGAADVLVTNATGPSTTGVGAFTYA